RPDRDEGTRKHGRSALRAVDEDEMQRPPSLNPSRDFYDGAVAHKGGVKFISHIAFGWACGSEAFRQLRRAVTERIRERRNFHARLERREIGQFRNKRPVNEHDAPRLNPPKYL